MIVPIILGKSALPANIRRLVFHIIKRDGITALHGIHDTVQPPHPPSPISWPPPLNLASLTQSAHEFHETCRSVTFYFMSEVIF